MELDLNSNTLTDEQISKRELDRKYFDPVCVDDFEKGIEDPSFKLCLDVGETQKSHGMTDFWYPNRRFNPDQEYS